MSALKIIPIVALAILGHSECNAQFARASAPIVTNSAGQPIPISKSDSLASTDGSSELGVALVIDGSLGHQLQDFYERCPGLVTAFNNLRKRPGFDMQFAPKGKTAFDRILDDALTNRRQLCDEYVVKNSQFNTTSGVSSCFAH